MNTTRPRRLTGHPATRATAVLAGLGLAALLAACQPVVVQGPDTYRGDYDRGIALGPEPRRVFRTANGRVFATAAERSAYLRRNAAEERRLIALDRQRQEYLAGSLRAQQAARRDVRADRLAERRRELGRDTARAEREAARAERAARQAEREARRVERRVRPRDIGPGPLPDASAIARRRDERAARRDALTADRAGFEAGNRARQAARRAEIRAAEIGARQRTLSREERIRGGVRGGSSVYPDLGGRR